MRIQIGVLAFIALTAGVVVFTPVKNSPPSDLRDAVSDSGFNTDVKGLLDRKDDGLSVSPPAATQARIPRNKSADISVAACNKDAISAQLDELLGVFDQLELQPAMGLPALSLEVARGLDSGAYDGVIMGESHDTRPEINAGIVIVKDILAARGIGAFSREKNLFPTTDFLEAQGVPVLTFSNQFKPDPDVRAGLKAARKKPLVTYTGYAHTATKLKNYVFYTLLWGKPWGYVSGGRDMPTVEESFLAAHKKPVIISMVAEELVLRRIGELFLNRLIAEGGASGQEYLENLRTLRSLWKNKVMRYPVRVEEISFARFPGQDNLFVGITPGDRRPVIVDAVLQVLPLPEFAPWLGGDRIKSVESLRSSEETGVSYRVVIRKFSGEIFERTVRP